MKSCSLNMSVRSRSNRNLEMLVFKEREKQEYPEKNLSSKEEDQRQTSLVFVLDSVGY